MKTKTTAFVVAVMMVAGLSGGAAYAAKSSAEMGKMLFNDRALGESANEKSCNSCHSDGKGLEKAGGNKKLSQLINKCVTGGMEGKKLDGRSVEMRSLKEYIATVGK